MSREILFKGKRIFDGEWIEGNVLNIKGEENPRIATSCLIGEQGEPLIVAAYEIAPETLCQYTGLTDKNGKKIWENDIVDGHTKRGAAFWRSVVLWNEYKARFDVRTMDCNFPMTLDEVVDDISVNGPDYVVIGNIFDNPELLEDSDLTD